MFINLYFNYVVNNCLSWFGVHGIYLLPEKISCPLHSSSFNYIQTLHKAHVILDLLILISISYKNEINRNS